MKIKQTALSVALTIVLLTTGKGINLSKEGISTQILTAQAQEEVTNCPDYNALLEELEQLKKQVSQLEEKHTKFINLYFSKTDSENFNVPLKYKYKTGYNNVIPNLEQEFEYDPYEKTIIQFRYPYNETTEDEAYYFAGYISTADNIEIIRIINYLNSIIGGEYSYDVVYLPDRDKNNDYKHAPCPIGPPITIKPSTTADETLSEIEKYTYIYVPSLMRLDGQLYYYNLESFVKYYQENPDNHSRSLRP